MMKKIGETVIVGLIIGLVIFVGSLADTVESNYTREGEIISIISQMNADTRVVIVEDTLGNEWAFEGNGYSLGQEVELKMFTNHTDNIITDDIVKKVIVKE